MSRRARIHEIESRERRGKWFPALAGLLTIALLASTWIGLFSFLGASSAYGTFSDVEQEYLPDISEFELDFPDLSRVSRVYAAGGELLAELHAGRVSEPTPLDQIPDVMIHAILAAEDKDFFEHEGLDFMAIARAALDNVLYDTRRGGSTITQQVVKQNFVGDEISIRRKIAEAFVAAELERRLSKELILEFYMNSVFFGSNAYGVTAAAREFFGKQLDDLEIHEAATLAVLVRSPSLYNPRKRPEVVRDRRDRVIDEMADSGWITPEEATTAKRMPLVVQEKQQFLGPADHIPAEVKRRLLDMTDRRWDFLGETKEERTKSIFGCPADEVACEGGGGLRIETTIDLEAQQLANDVLAEWFPLLPYEENLEACRRLFPNDSEDFLAAYAETHSCAPTGAIATVENDTGAIVAMASGLPFDLEQFDLAVQGKRNPGSSFKPFTLVAALEEGYSLGSYWNGASPQEFECECPPTGTWRVSNAGSSLPMISLAQATYQSVNVVYAQVALTVGADKVVETAEAMGIESTLRPFPSITLGTSEVSPLEMASAYSNFATNGQWAEPYLISRILDSTGSVIYGHSSQPVQVSRPAVFAAARTALEQVPTSAGTAFRANIGRPQGGKTGTHQNFQDAWYVGFVRQYSTAVWVGYEAKQVPLRSVSIHGETYSTVSGGRVPAPIWAQYMEAFLSDVPVEDFPMVDPLYLQQYTETPITQAPSVVGLDAETAKELIFAARLYPWEVPVASLEPEGTVTGQNFVAGSEVAQGETMFINVASGEIPIAPLPNPIGSTYTDALDMFRQLEFDTGVRVNISRLTVSAPGYPDGVVVDMSPSPGTEVGYGALVTLSVSG